MKRTLALLCSTAFVVFAMQLGLQACGPTEDDFDAGDDYDAGRQDAAVAPTCADYIGDPCGSITDFGECVNVDADQDKELLVWCDGTTLNCYDCAGDSAGPFHCATWNSTYGNDCLAGDGQACSVDFPNNNDNLTGCDPAIGTCTGGTCQ